MSQLDQTRTHFSLSMLDARKSCSRRPIFGLNGISRTSRRVALLFKMKTVVSVKSSCGQLDFTDATVDTLSTCGLYFRLRNTHSVALG